MKKTTFIGRPLSQDATRKVGRTLLAGVFLLSSLSAIANSSVGLITSSSGSLEISSDLNVIGGDVAGGAHATLIAPNLQVCDERTSMVSRFNATGDLQVCKVTGAVDAEGNPIWDWQTHQVVGSNIATGAVGGTQIADDSVAEQHVRADAVGGDQIRASSVSGMKLLENAISSRELGDNAVGTSHLKNNAVTTDKIASGAVTTDKIAANAVTNGKLADNAVSTRTIGNAQVTADKLANNAVTTAKIAAGAITKAKLGSEAQGGHATTANLKNCTTSRAIVTNNAAQVGSWWSIGGNVDQVRKCTKIDSFYVRSDMRASVVWRQTWECVAWGEPVSNPLTLNCS